MAIQQLTQPIINPISAFDSTRAHTISFVVIGGAQVIGNRLVISNNQTGKEIYNKIQSTMKLEHLIPANTLTNGGYYNAVVYTIDSANNESVASAAVPFYCYSQPNLTIDNIPATETIENGTYKFVGNYLQQENELLNSYQYTLYDSNKNVLSQSALIYYDTDSSLSYTFVGMSNDTAYYIELSGETVNGTKITSGLKYFTVRYIQPASFAICDLVNNCEDGYIQISSNIVAIDGKSNPDPPIYIDDKEVDLRDPDSWVEWNSGFRIQDDFTMRVWGRDFNDYQNIITLTNDINTTSTPNRIELKWMIGDVIKTLPSYTTVEGKSINILDAEAAKIQNLSVGGNLEQKKEDEIDFGTDKSLTMNTDKELPLQVSVLGNSEQKTSIQNENLLILEDGTQTLNGVTMTIKDGIITFNGTATASTFFRIKIKEKLKTGDYYHLATEVSGSHTKNIALGVVDVEEKTIYSEFNGGGGSPFNLPNDEYITYRIWVANGNVINNQIYKCMISKGSEHKKWVKGIPNMPSPDYPSEIKTVGNNVNEFDIDTVKNGFLNEKTGEIISNNSWKCSDFIEILNKTYTFGWESSSDYFQVTVCYYDENKKFISGKSYGLRGTFNNTFEVVSNAKYMKIAYSVSVSGELVTREKIKLEKGKVATSYSKFGQGSVKVTKFNKNIFKETYNRKDATSAYASIVKGEGFFEKDKTYVISFDTTNNGGILYLGEYSFQHINTYTVKCDGTRKFFTAKAKEFGYVTDMTVLKTRAVTTNAYNISNVMINEYENDTDIDYVQHEEQSYILPIQQEMLEDDSFTLGLNKKEIHTWGKKILTGEEDWNASWQNTAQKNSKSFALPKSFFGNEVPDFELNRVHQGLSSHFPEMFNTVWSKDTDCIAISSDSNLCLQIRLSRNTLKYDDNITTSDLKKLFQDWLKAQYDAGTPVTVYYKLKISTSIPCTSEQNKILDELNQLEPYYPQTNIYTEENIALINAKYLGSPSPYRPSEIHALGDIKNLINIPEFNVNYTQQYSQSTNTNFILKSDFIYTLSFDYNVNKTNTDLYYSIGYGTNEYDVDLKSNIQYKSLTKGRNSVSFIVPENIPNNATLWVKFAQTIILADINVDISNIQLESGNISTGYEDPNLYNIYPTSASKNLFNYDSPVYLLKNNANYKPIQNGYNIKPIVENQDAYIGIGIKNVLNSGDIYSISFSQSGQFEKFNLYTTEKGSKNIISEIPINNNKFVAPEGVYDLQLVFGVDSSSLSNYIEIWNIQIEANNAVSEYEPYISNSSVISLDEPLRGIGAYRDLICLESPNILNPETQSGIVKGNTAYYLNQTGNTQYYIWYYNEDGNLIKFIDDEGHEASGISGTKGSFITHKDCVKIIITKSSNPDSQDVTSDELKTNHVGITKGSAAQVYYPYVTEPSIFRYIKKKVLNGTEEINLIWDAYNKHGYRIAINDIRQTTSTEEKSLVISNSYQTYKQDDLFNLKYRAYGISNRANNSGIIIRNDDITTVSDFKTSLASSNALIYYVVDTPIISKLSDDNISALKSLSTYKPISNLFTNNEVFGYLKLDYISDYTEQQTQNAYVLLKCWNANSMPYICHSNYIDIPDEKDKVFIWMRRKNNLFDLKIENLGNYNEDDKPTDKTKPIVTLEINPNNVEATRIPVTAYSIDDNGLKTVRFSKDNGNTWDEIVNVDGLSSTNSYIFINLNPNTTYTIRVEAIDLAGNIGGISQQVTTKSS